jgi:multiple sugar transport system ATP-binding protein
MFVDGGTFRLRVPAGKATVLAESLNKEVILGIRPEDTYDRKFAHDANADNTLKVTVDVVEPMGSEVNLYLLTGKKTFVAKLDARTQVQPNEIIDVVWDMNKMHVFDRETQTALA